MQRKGKHELPVTKKITLKRSGRPALFATTVVSVLGLLITLSGTYGYHDQTQHKTNEFKTTEIDREVFLIGETEDKTPKNWQVNQTLKREIRVKNAVENPIPATTQFEPLYIRLNLDEFLEFATQAKQYSDKRYLQDNSNKLIHFKTEKEALDFVTGKALQDEVTPEQIKTEADVNAQGADFSGYWYLAVNATQPTGWHSERLVLSTQTSAPTSLIPGVANAKQDAVDKHHEVSHGEDAYTTHLFESDLTPLGISQAFETYVMLGFSKDVISLAQWVTDYDAKPVKKWIVDTGNTNGWVYWGEILPVRATTANLLETTTLKYKPQGQLLYYAIHADLDAINQAELNKSSTWNDLPAQLRQAWQAQK
ncbi:hypothetical protein RyT2_22270 [Pseudolactococcus yaeyamensis]